MHIPWNAKGTFRERPNRFLGIVDITSPKNDKKKNVKVHVHDPGRLKELLYPGNQVLLREAENPNRKTRWDLIAAKCKRKWVLVHSGFHRGIAEWVLKNPNVNPFGRLREIRPEVRFGDSRLDFLLTKRNGKRIWVEVKGCTLAEDGVALFPDAPTTRGTRHINHLIKARRKGDEAAIIILIFRTDVRCFAPNRDTDFEFYKAFAGAVRTGVKAYPLIFGYRNREIYYHDKTTLCDQVSSS